MKRISRNLPYLAVALMTLIIGLAAGSALAQDTTEVNKEKIKAHAEKIKADLEKVKDDVEKVKEKAEKIKEKAEQMQRGFCENNNWSSDDKVSVNELREMTVAAGGTLNVDGRQNGGISVKGEERSDILLRACVQAWGPNAESAKSLAGSVRIDTGSTIKADNPAGDNNWSVSYQIAVPRSTNLNLKAHNGGISIGNVDGTIEFDTLNGGVSLGEVSGSVKGRTTNGGVNINLSGTSWKGSGLDVTTTNGGVNLSIPENFAAHVETGTVNGGFSSDIPGLSVEKTDVNGRRVAPRINTDLNGGGAPIRVITTNGGIRINSKAARRVM